MKVDKHHLRAEKKYEIHSENLGDKAHLVLYFAGRETLENHDIYHSLQRTYPNAILMGCSTGGEINEDDVFDETCVSIALSFEKTLIKPASVSIDFLQDSFKAGVTIGEKLKGSDLKSIFLLSDGLNVNGSELVKGILKVVGSHIPVMGGLAGDGALFSKTLVGLNAVPSEHQVCAVGFYGNHIHIGYGADAGIETFGPERLITKSKGNILYELDGKSVLELYKEYLGKYAQDIPASALLFPLGLKSSSLGDIVVLRTVLSINEDEQSLVFAGDVPQGSIVQFMRTNRNHFLKGAQKASEHAEKILRNSDRTIIGDSLSLLVSCIGRKLVMGHNVVDEVDAVKNILSSESQYQAGFFSYGEICPHIISGISELHNETMTISILSEVE